MTATDYTTDAEYLSLLRRVLENPADDAPRLILSDWIEEHGDDDRAEFIRLQCRIARLQLECNCGSCVKIRGGGQHHNGPCAVDRERDELPDGRSKQAFLRIREEQLKTSIWDRLFEGYNHFELVVRRGFAETVRMTCAEFVGGQCDACDGQGSTLGDPECRYCRGAGRVEYAMSKYSDGLMDCDECSRTTCSDCHGTGHIEGIARELFERHPLTRVMLTDKKPTGGCWFFVKPSDRDYGRIADTLPSELIMPMSGATKENHFVGGITGYYTNAARFTTETAALDALSDACVAYGRQLVGLPPLTAQPQSSAVG